MGWWSDFRDNILKPVGGVVLLGNVLGGGGSGGIFKGLFGGGGGPAATGAGLSTAAGGVLPSMVPGSAAANILLKMGTGAAAAGTATAGSAGLLGGLGKTLGGSSGSLMPALMLSQMGKVKVPQVEAPQLDAKSQAMQNQLNSLVSNRLGDYSNALGSTDMTQVRQQYQEYLKKLQEQGAATGFKPIPPTM